MAMSMRTRGPAASTTTHPPLSDEFKPLIESKEDPEAHTVYIRLPGFAKEQIRIVAESSRGVLRVRGERFIEGSRWSRFHEEVPVPDNCDITETRAKFEGGVLRITMPKTIQSLSPATLSLSDEPTTPERSPPRPAPVSRPQPHLAPERPVSRPQPHPAPARPVVYHPQPHLDPARPVSRPQPYPTALEPVSALPQTRPVALPPPPALRPVAALSPPPPALRPAAALGPPPPALRPAEALGPPPPALRPAAALDPPPRLMPSIQPKPRDYDEDIPKQSLPMPPWQTPPPEITPVVHPILRPREDEKPESEGNRKPFRLPPKSTPAGMLQALPQPDPAPWKEKRPEMAIKRAGPTLKAYEPWKEEEERMKMRRMGEDRQLLVNIGAAVMVIVGLGAWISYSLGSPANTTN